MPNLEVKREGRNIANVHHGTTFFALEKVPVGSGHNCTSCGESESSARVINAPKLYR